MNQKSIFYLLFTIILLFLLGNISTTDPTEPNYEFVPDMVHSVAYDAFSENPNYKDNKTLQLPPEGTIPIGFLPEYLDGELTLENAGDVLKNPLLANEINNERGAFVYHNFCSVCHGPTGAGDGSVTKRGVPAPPSIKTEKIKNMKDGELYFIISNGIGNMPPYNVQINRKDRWQLTQYIKTLK